MKEPFFLIRIYGIYIDPDKGLLVSDELIQGRKITKLPGGGLEYGEGTIDCLKREMMEETGSAFTVISHFYTTDYFVESAFHKERQVISIYYLIEPVDALQINFAKEPFDFTNMQDELQSFRFIPLNEIRPDQFTLTIDRHVASLLMKNYP